MDWLKKILSGLNWWQKLIVIIALAVITYFVSGCSYKFHADSVDNFTREVIFHK